MKIYIASSFRNLHAVQLLTNALRARVHNVIDWTQLAPPLLADMKPEDRRSVLDSDSRGEIFKFCVNACASADLVIYLGASGQDAACEVGIAYNAGVPVIGLRGPLEAPGLILTKAVSVWYSSVEELLDEIDCMM